MAIFTISKLPAEIIILKSIYLGYESLEQELKIPYAGNWSYD